MAQGPGKPAQVVAADGSVVTARRGVVVAVEGPEALRMMGFGLEVRGCRHPGGCRTTYSSTASCVGGCVGRAGMSERGAQQGNQSPRKA